MKHPPGSMGSCFIWQRTAEPPSFCPAVPSFLEFKQNKDCSLIEKQVLWVLRRNNCCSATASTRGIDCRITGTETNVFTEGCNTIATLQSNHVQLSGSALFTARCRYSNLLNFRKKNLCTCTSHTVSALSLHLQGV